MSSRDSAATAAIPPLVRGVVASAKQRKGGRHEPSVGLRRGGADLCVLRKPLSRAGGAEPRGSRSRGRRNRLAGPRRHDDRAALLAARASQQGYDRGLEARVVRRVRHEPRPRGDADRRRRRALYDYGLEQGLRRRRQDRRARLVLRPESAGRDRRQGVLRREQPRPRGRRRQGVRRDARRPPDRSRPEDWHAALEHRHGRPNAVLHDHGRAARNQEQGADRQLGRRARSARLRERLRYGERRALVALLRRAGRPGEGTRRRRVRRGARDSSLGRRGSATSTTSTAAAARLGTRSSTTRSSTRSTSARAMARRGAAGSAPQARATTCSSRRCSR